MIYGEHFVGAFLGFESESELFFQCGEDGKDQEKHANSDTQSGKRASIAGAWHRPIIVSEEKKSANCPTLGPGTGTS